jgi:hypothetical protein
MQLSVIVYAARSTTWFIAAQRQHLISPADPGANRPSSALHFQQRQGVSAVLTAVIALALSSCRSG